MPSIYNGKFHKNSMSGRMLAQGGAQSLGASGARGEGSGPQGSSLRNPNLNAQTAELIKQQQPKPTHHRRNISKISNENKSFQNFSQRGVEVIAPHSDGRSKNKFVHPKKAQQHSSNIRNMIHNMSVGEEGVGQALIGGSNQGQHLAGEPVAGKAQMNSRKMSKVGRRSSTTHEQSHANQYFMSNIPQGAGDSNPRG